MARALQGRWMMILALALVAASSVGCASWKRDRCYLAETRYMLMRDLFIETNSYQQVAQSMKADQWSRCEVNTFRYRLRKDLELEGEEFKQLTAELEPNRSEIEFHPGRVERTVETDPRLADR